MALFRTLPTPTNDLLPRLMVEVCLVLAPDVNFFLNSRKQGLPCLRSLFFSILDRCRVRKLTLKLNTLSIQYATKIINTSRRLKNI